MLANPVRTKLTTEAYITIAEKAEQWTDTYVKRNGPLVPEEAGVGRYMVVGDASLKINTGLDEADVSSEQLQQFYQAICEATVKDRSTTGVLETLKSSSLRINPIADEEWINTELQNHGQAYVWMFYGRGAYEEVQGTGMENNPTPRWRLCRVHKQGNDFAWAPLAIKEVVREITPNDCDSTEVLRSKPIEDIRSEYDEGLITGQHAVDLVSQEVFLGALWFPAKRPEGGADAQLTAASLSRPPAETDEIILILSVGLDRVLDYKEEVLPREFEIWHQNCGIKETTIVNKAIRAFTNASDHSKIPRLKEICRRDILGLASAALFEDGVNATLSRATLGGHLICKCLVGTSLGDRALLCSDPTNPLGLCGTCNPTNLPGNVWRKLWKKHCSPADTPL